MQQTANLSSQAESWTDTEFMLRMKLLRTIWECELFDSFSGEMLCSLMEKYLEASGDADKEATAKTFFFEKMKDPEKCGVTRRS